ncbi:MAG: pimeloyl-ACP methyl esterase BioG family protein, partial [Succinivibrio sp.]
TLTLISWSMGVMIAPMVLNDHSLLGRVRKSYAINGTLEGIDDELGIPLRLWMATISSMSDANVIKFYRRMCLDAILYEEYTGTKPDRDTDSLKRELESIIGFSQKKRVDGFTYDLAFIGLKDKIMDPKAMQKSFALKNTKVKLTDAAHYSKDVFIEVLQHNDTQ